MKHRRVILAVLASTRRRRRVHSSPSRTRPASSSGTTLDLTGTVTGFHVALDAKLAGQSAGDIGYETGHVVRATASRRPLPGRLHPAPHAELAVLVHARPSQTGQIVDRKPPDGPASTPAAVAREAIVGGTGAYAGTRGQGLDRELSNTKLAFHLELSQ